MHDFGFDHKTNFFIKGQTPGGNFFFPEYISPQVGKYWAPPFLCTVALIKGLRKKKQIAMITK
jgi:hypothetical protein